MIEAAAPAGTITQAFSWLPPQARKASEPANGSRRSTLRSAAHVKPRYPAGQTMSAAVRGKPTVTPTTRPAQTPSAICPWTPLRVDPQ